MRQIAIATLLIGIIATAAAAGDAPIRFGGFGGFSPGAQYLDVSGVNDYLEPFDTKFASLVPYIGGFGYGLLFEHLVIGGRGGAAQQQSSGSLADIRYRTGNGHLEFGYAVLNDGRGLAFPFIGIGGAVQRLTLENDNIFTELFIGEDATIRKSSGYATLGFSYRYPLRFAQSPSGGFGMVVVGAHAGVTLQLTDKGWEGEDGADFPGGPETKFNTLFILVDIGLGGGTTAGE